MVPVCWKLSLKKDLQIKQLNVELSDLDSKFKTKSLAMEKMKEEHRLVLKQYRQLKVKTEKDVAAGFSQGAISDSLETDPGVRMCIYYCIMLYLCNVK